MLKIAFASNDRARVNLHFGGADSLVVYDVSAGWADLVGVGQFVKADPTGTSIRAGLENTAQDKLAAKLEFLKDCTAVYAANIGASAIRRLMLAGIQPIIVDEGHDIVDLLNEVSLAICCGGLPWVEHAVAKAGSAARVAGAGAVGAGMGERYELITSIGDLPD
ncbi:MAG: NifB/NifX family molybdenum-iron cluster-binding protein [Defluviicoccus sp.]|nr:NifB/NifX family molybdenum-iron cluster-binding protein [Defluviicoccus sp.]